MKTHAFNKVVKTIQGCINERQLESAKNLIDNYYKTTDNSTEYMELMKEYYLKKEELENDV